MTGNIAGQILVLLKNNNLSLAIHCSWLYLCGIFPYLPSLVAYEVKCCSLDINCSPQAMNLMFSLQPGTVVRQLKTCWQAVNMVQLVNVPKKKTRF